MSSDEEVDLSPMATESEEFEPEEVIEEYKQNILSKEIAEAACLNDPDALKRLLGVFWATPGVEATLGQLSSPLKEAYNWIAMKRFTLYDGVHSCSENLSDEVFGLLTLEGEPVNYTLYTMLLDSLIIWNQDGKNYNLIRDMSKKLPPHQVAEVLTSALNIILALSVVEIMDRVGGTEGTAGTEGKVPLSTSPMNITSDEARAGVLNSIIPLSGLEMPISRQSALSKIVARTVDQKRVVKLLVALKNLEDAGLNKILKKAIPSAFAET